MYVYVTQDTEAIIGWAMLMSNPQQLIFISIYAPSLRGMEFKEPLLEHMSHRELRTKEK